MTGTGWTTYSPRKQRMCQQITSCYTQRLIAKWRDVGQTTAIQEWIYF